MRFVTIEVQMEEMWRQSCGCYALRGGAMFALFEMWEG